MGITHSDNNCTIRGDKYGRRNLRTHCVRVWYTLCDRVFTVSTPINIRTLYSNRIRSHYIPHFVRLFGDKEIRVHARRLGEGELCAIKENCVIFSRTKRPTQGLRASAFEFNYISMAIPPRDGRRHGRHGDDDERLRERSLRRHL